MIRRWEREGRVRTMIYENLLKIFEDSRRQFGEKRAWQDFNFAVIELIENNAYATELVRGFASRAREYWSQDQLDEEKLMSLKIDI